MNLLLKFAVVSVLTSATPAFSEQEVGNGGDVIYCETDSGSTAELLDHYEARVLRAKVIDLGSDRLGYAQKVRFVLDRWATKDPTRVAMLREWADEFMSVTALLPGVVLVDVPDSDHIAIPKGCSIAQVAIQATPRFPDDPRYTISKDLWDLLSADGKAGLILHEIIYREAISQRNDNSIATRYLNALVSTVDIAFLNANEYRHLLDIVSLPVRFLWTDPLTNCHVRSWGDGWVMTMDEIKDFDYRSMGQALVDQGSIDEGGIDNLEIILPAVNGDPFEDLLIKFFSDRYETRPAPGPSWPAPRFFIDRDCAERHTSGQGDGGGDSSD